MKKLAIEHIDNLMRANGLDSVSAKDFRAQRKQDMTSPEQDRYEADLEFARDVESEVLRINGLTAEAAEQREQGQVVEAAWAFANAVWAEMDRLSMPGIYMQLVVQSIVKHYTTPPTPPAGVPDGFVLVPVEPTDEMRDAGNEIILDRGKLFRAWAAMLSAAPQPAAQPEDIPAIFKEQAS